MVLYQLEPNQFSVIEVHKEVHVNSTGNRTELYPTNIIYFPFMEYDYNTFINPFCNALGIPGSCDVIFVGIRTLSQVSIRKVFKINNIIDDLTNMLLKQTVQTTYAERYWFSVLRSLVTTAALLELILGIEAQLYLIIY